ncbi:hypothetical protein ACFL6C_10765 [Myxococcota bacterium]
MRTGQSTIDEINRLHEEAGRIARESGGDSGELRKSQQVSREVLCLALKAVEQHPDDGMLWHLLLGGMSQSGVWRSDDGDYDEMRLRAINNMIRLNPDDDEAAYAGSAFGPDYAYHGGLYALKFSALVDLYYLGCNKEAGWPDSEHGKEAKEAIQIAMKRFPDAKRFLLEQAAAVGIELG